MELQLASITAVVDVDGLSAVSSNPHLIDEIAIKKLPANTITALNLLPCLPIDMDEFSGPWCSINSYSLVVLKSLTMNDIYVSHDS